MQEGRNDIPMPANVKANDGYSIRIRRGIIERLGIEILPEDFEKLLREETRTRIYEALKSYGFSYVTLDMKGYRTGSMNETITKEGKNCLTK